MRKVGYIGIVNSGITNTRTNRKRKDERKKAEIG